MSTSEEALVAAGPIPERLGRALVALGLHVDVFRLTHSPACAYYRLAEPVYDLLAYAIRDGRPVAAYAGLVDLDAFLPAIEACRTDLEAIEAAERLTPRLQLDLEALWPIRTCEATGHLWSETLWDSHRRICCRCLSLAEVAS